MVLATAFGVDMEKWISFFIRLRLEIVKLLEKGVFPYNPQPLLRRLVQIEALVETQ